MIHYKNITVQKQCENKTVIKWFKIGIEQDGILIVTREDMTTEKHKLGKSVWRGQQITPEMFNDEATSMVIKHDNKKHELRLLRALAIDEEETFLSGNISHLRQLKLSNDKEYHSLKKDVLNELKRLYKLLSQKEIWEVVKTYIK
tara:strand:- start:1773 stop:2207 length:435 start_codon:yes stop_codon:yes gene_type:complete